jgi:general secretion pathway protein K
MPRCSERNEQGSVLIIVLILMMVAVSLALYTVSLSRDIIATTQQLQDKLQARLESRSVIEKIKYIGSIGKFSSWNIENLSGNREFPLRLNLRGTPITVGNSELRLIDSAGRLRLWPPDTYVLKRLLQVDGVKPGEADVAVDSLLDWIDEDDLKRLNGAEKYYYRSERSLAYQPRNSRFIQTISELELIRGFRGTIFDQVKDEIIDSGGAKFNINTVDTQLLAALLDIDLESANRLVAVREKNGVLSNADLIAIGRNDLTNIDGYITNIPSKTLAVEVRTRINDAGDVEHAIISFRPRNERFVTVEKFDE